MNIGHSTERVQRLNWLYQFVFGLLLTLTMFGCSDDDANQSMSNTLGNSTQGYKQVKLGRVFSFPEDHLSHPDYRQEWWYLTANLKTDHGEKLGLQWTQFRIALSPPSIEDYESFSNEWATKQLYMAHSAVTTESVHLAQEKWSREHPELAIIKPQPLSIKLDDWLWQSEGTKLFPATLSVTTDKFNYQLVLSSDSPIQLQGDMGYSRKSADGQVASYYYSQPFIKVNGQIDLDGKRRNVTGEAWLDREWSSQFLAQSQQGWDWFALRLTDGSALVLFQLRATNSKHNNFYSGRRMFPDGTGYNITSSEIEMKPTRYEQIDGNDYPVDWQIKIPKEQIVIEVSALNRRAKMPLSIPYWEGPVRFSGTHSGEGYMELTGY